MNSYECKNCGAQLNDNFKECKYCGTPNPRFSPRYKDAGVTQTQNSISRVPMPQTKAESKAINSAAIFIALAIALIFVGFVLISLRAYFGAFLLGIGFILIIISLFIYSSRKKK